METRPGQHCLPRGSRRPLLLRALCAGQAATRRPAECAGRGPFSQGAPRGQPSALPTEGPAPPGPGTPAHGPSTLGGVDAPAAHALGGPQRPRDGTGGRNDFGLTATSAAGVPVLL